MHTSYSILTDAGLVFSFYQHSSVYWNRSHVEELIYTIEKSKNIQKSKYKFRGQQILFEASVYPSPHLPTIAEPQLKLNYDVMSYI